MKETKELITPKIAARYLNANTNNRPLRSGHAEKMVADMVAKCWTVCAAPVIFYEDGSLADGQHRLFAIVESGIAQRFTVIRDFPKAAGINIDTNIPRNAVDASHIHGIDLDMNTTVASVARGMESGQPSQGKRGLTMSESLVILAKHREAAHWAAKNGPYGRGLRSSPVLSAIGRAYYVERERERLMHFGQIVTKGFIDNVEDSAAVALRNYLISKIAARSHVTSSVNWRDTFLKAQHAINQFMRHKPLTLIKAVADETYPLVDNMPKAPTTQRGRANVKRVEKAAARRSK